MVSSAGKGREAVGIRVKVRRNYGNEGAEDGGRVPMKEDDLN